MIILHVAPTAWGGIAGRNVSVPGLISAQNCLDGVNAALVVTAANRERPPEMGFPIFDSKTLLSGSRRLGLPAPFDRPHLLVFHGINNTAYAGIARRVRKVPIPYVICPRGGMTRYAQAYKWWKKKIANLLLFNKVVAHAVALHCLTHGEAEASSGWGRPMFVVGNGTDLPGQSDLASPGRSSGLRLVFLGRLHIGFKGLDMLLDACDLVRSEMLRSGVRLELHGPDWEGSMKVLAGRIARLHLEDIVALHGPVVGEAKTSVLKQADVFMHPSRSEGHPMAVLEAMAHGLPCLLTPNTNMADEVAEVGAGWKVEPSPPGIAEGIKKVLTAERRTLQEAGLRARQLAVGRYSWEEIAGCSVEAYRKYAA